MAGFREREKRHFPLQDVRSVVNLFKDQLENSDQPNLALLSIVLGVIENALTVNRAIPQHFESDKLLLQPIFPVVELSTVEALYQTFVAQVKGSVDMTLYDTANTSRELVKKVSDVIWNSLTRTYCKDKAHLQSLYSYLTGNKLDCFGVAFAVVAACQILDIHDVHLCLSEDHAWVVFGDEQDETAEVTWHGKGNEDKRGQSITLGVAEKSWLYLNGHAVLCTRQMEVAAMVSAINPAINAAMDSVEMGFLQQDLLWLLYDMGHLEKYPMAIGNLADLEEITPTSTRPAPMVLFTKAIDSGWRYYDNYHVYPYTYLGGYFYRKTHYKEAVRNWAEASNVIKKYNYNREDEEIYKEFLEIANDMIPHMVRHLAEGAPYVCEPGAPPLLDDPQCYALLLKFYDGICQWEEDSSTPVLHVGWAKHLCFSLSKFTSIARRGIEVHAEGEEDVTSEEEGEEERETVENGKDRKEEEEERGEKRRLTRLKLRRDSQSEKVLKGHPSHNNNTHSDSQVKDLEKTNNKTLAVNGKSAEEEKIQTTIQELESKVRAESQDETPNPNIDALAKACGESILNPEYLLSGGEPFATTSRSSPFSATKQDIRVDFTEFLSSKSNGSPFRGMSMDSMLKAESPADMVMCKAQVRPDSVHSMPDSVGSMPDSVGSMPDSVGSASIDMENAPRMTLFSEKMKGLKSLLTQEKLNASAIKLQLTAQSQVQLKHSKISSEYASDFGMPTRKRLRRE